jgi:hypothetical protein
MSPIDRSTNKISDTRAALPSLNGPELVMRYQRTHAGQPKPNAVGFQHAGN